MTYKLLGLQNISSKLHFITHIIIFYEIMIELMFYIRILYPQTNNLKLINGVDMSLYISYTEWVYLWDKQKYTLQIKVQSAGQSSHPTESKDCLLRIGSKLFFFTNFYKIADTFARLGQLIQYKFIYMYHIQIFSFALQISNSFEENAGQLWDCRQLIKYHSHIYVSDILIHPAYL